MQLLRVAILTVISLRASANSFTSHCDAICAAKSHFQCNSDTAIITAPNSEQSFCRCGLANAGGENPVTNPCIVCREKIQQQVAGFTRKVCETACPQNQQPCNMGGVDTRIFGADTCTGSEECAEQNPTTTTTTTTMSTQPAPSPPVSSNDDDYTDLYLKTIGPVAGVVVVEVGVLAVSYA